MQDQSISEMRKSIVNEAYEYNLDIWVVSALNTQGLIYGHTAIVVEGLIKDNIKFFVKPYIAHIDIIADESAFRNVVDNIDNSIIKNLNKKGYITQIRCDESNDITAPPRDYKNKNWPKQSWEVNATKVVSMLSEIKQDIDHTKKAYENHRLILSGKKPIHFHHDGHPRELFLYQRLGADHPLVLLFGDTSAGNNCASYCSKKLNKHLELNLHGYKPKSLTRQCHLL